MKVLAMYKQMSTIDGAFPLQEIQLIHCKDRALNEGASVNQSVHVVMVILQDHSK